MKLSNSLIGLRHSLRKISRVCVIASSLLSTLNAQDGIDSTVQSINPLLVKYRDTIMSSQLFGDDVYDLVIGPVAKTHSNHKKKLTYLNLILYGNDNYLKPYIGNTDVNTYRSDRYGGVVGVEKGGYDGGKSFHFAMEGKRKGDNRGILGTVEYSGWTHGRKLKRKVKERPVLLNSLDQNLSIENIHYDTIDYRTDKNEKRIDLVDVQAIKTRHWGIKTHHTLGVGGGVVIASNLRGHQIQNTWHQKIGVRENTATYESETVVAPNLLATYQIVGPVVDKKYLGVDLTGSVDGKRVVTGDLPSHIQATAWLTGRYRSVLLQLSTTLGYSDGQALHETIREATVGGLQHRISYALEIPLPGLRHRRLRYKLGTYHLGGYRSFPQSNIDELNKSYKGEALSEVENQMQLGIIWRR